MDWVDDLDEDLVSNAIDRLMDPIEHRDPDTPFDIPAHWGGLDRRHVFLIKSIKRLKTNPILGGRVGIYHTRYLCGAYVRYDHRRYPAPVSAVVHPSVLDTWRGSHVLWQDIIAKIVRGRVD